MKDRGLGTAATRAAIIETVLRREYLRRKGKSLEATEKGIHLIDVVHAAVKSPAMTGEWEAQLREIERGQGQFQKFMQGIEEYLRHVVGEKPAEPSKVQGQPSPTRSISHPFGRRRSRSDLGRPVPLSKQNGALWLRVRGLAHKRRSLTPRPRWIAVRAQLVCLRARTVRNRVGPGWASCCGPASASSHSVPIRRRSARQPPPGVTCYW